MRFQMGSADRACFTQAGKHKFLKKTHKLLLEMPAQNACLGLIAVQKQQERERERGWGIISLLCSSQPHLSFPSFPFIALPSLAER
jgi:hypothetical protein